MNMRTHEYEDSLGLGGGQTGSASNRTIMFLLALAALVVSGGFAISPSLSSMASSFSAAARCCKSSRRNGVAAQNVVVDVGTVMEKRHEKNLARTGRRRGDRNI